MVSKTKYFSSFSILADLYLQLVAFWTVPGVNRITFTQTRVRGNDTKVFSSNCQHSP